MEGIGWIPFEVTPGYSSYGTKHPTEEDSEKLEEIAEQRREDLESAENSESENPEDSETQNNPENETEDSNNTEDSTSTEDSIGTEDSSNHPGIGIGNDGSGAGSRLWDWLLQGLQWLVMAGLLILAMMSVLVGIQYWMRRYETILTVEIQKNLTRKAVKRMNKRIYRILRVRNPKYWFAGKMTDRVYEQVLAETYTQISQEEWMRYMEIVKKNHYSYETISTEEMQYCYECYKKVNIFNKLLTSKWFNRFHKHK